MKKWGKRRKNGNTKGGREKLIQQIEAFNKNISEIQLLVFNIMKLVTDINKLRKINEK